MTRRTFGALLAASVASAAFAGAPAPLLEGRYTATRAQDGMLEVRLFLVNRSTETLSVLHKRGHEPGAALTAKAQGETLQIVPVPEPATRVGPRPVYASLAPGAELELGPWRLEADPASQLTVSAAVTLQAQEPIALPEQKVAVVSP